MLISPRGLFPRQRRVLLAASLLALAALLPDESRAQGTRPTGRPGRAKPAPTAKPTVTVGFGADRKYGTPEQAMAGGGRPGAIAPLAGPYDTAAFAALKWREIGPYRGGRSVAVAGSAARPMEFWFGTTGGGVFKSTDGGQSWGPASDKAFGGTVGAIAVSPSNPDIVWVGTGEYAIRGNVSHGDGVWRTTDGGKTWAHLGLADSRQIARVRVHPTNPDIAYVGVQGNVWAPSTARGVYRTRDAGKTWQRVFYRDSLTGTSDLVMDPTNPNVLYAAFWTAYRKPWQLVSGGAGSGIFKSTDGGDHWTELTRNAGLPKGLLGNIGIDVSPVRPNRVWAIIEADSGGVFMSDDAGATWRRTNDERKLRQRAWYYTKIHADSKDSNTVFVNNVSFNKSSDGGKTFRALRPPHGDSHDFWIAPNDNQRMIEGDDGGATVSMNGGKTWTEQDFATAQFYHVTTTTHFPYRVCGAQQDNSTLCGPSRKEGGIDAASWYEVGGGESGYIAARPDDPDVVYAGSYGGLLTRTNVRTNEQRDVNPWPLNPMGHSAEDLQYRFQWTFPIVLSPFDPNTIYAASNVLFRSTNGGQRWTAISPDLTRHDRATLGASGGPLTKDQTSIEYFATIFAVAESPRARGTIWTGSDDGLVQLTRDDGAHWTNVTPRDLPVNSRVSIIEASHHDAGTAYLAANRFQLDDMHPYLFRTTDYGKSWTRIDAGIDPTEFTRVIREDPVKPGLLYAGTERGVWVSFDDGAHWQSLRKNLPIVPVHDLAITEGDLVAATHGRSFWIMDDLTALRSLTPAIVASSAHLFQPRDAWRVQWGQGNPTAAHHPDGANPPSGAVVYYWLKAQPKEVRLDFLDGAGKVIRSFTSLQDSAARADSLRTDSTTRARRDSLAKTGLSADSVKKLEARSEETAPVGGEEEGGRNRRQAPPRVPAKAGLNQFAWNLRYPDASTFEGLIMWAGGVTGPTAPPGTYAVRMVVDGDSAHAQTARFTLKKDPRSSATEGNLVEQFTLLMRIRNRLSEANDAVKTIRNVRAQLDDREAKLAPRDKPMFVVLATVLRERLGRIEDSLYQTKNRSSQDPLNFPIRLNNEISALGGSVSYSDTKPTDQQYTVFNILSMKLDVHMLDLKQTLGDIVPRVNQVLAGLKLAPIVPSTDEVRPAKPAAASGDEEDEEGEQRRW